MQITSGKASIAAASHGTGEPTVLLIHAGVTDQRSWEHVVARLPGHRCLTYDQRGYGLTTYDEEDGWSAVGDAVAVLDGYGAGRAVVVACSMGGRVALDLALTHPERVAALVLIAPAISGQPQPTYEPEVEALGEQAEAAEAADDEDLVNEIDARVWLDGPSRPGRVQGPVRDLFLDMNGIALRAPAEGERAEDASAWSRLGEIGVPTLLMIGDLDLAYLKGNIAHAAAAIPSARVVDLPGVAHVPHLEGDERTLREIAAFVGGFAAGI
jgi:pimeloyl-ACP methyl ester carboxylesterase